MTLEIMVPAATGRSTTMPAGSGGHGSSSRKRERWDVVAPAMRQSIERARDATRGQKATLLAVHYLLALFQRLEDRVSLGQIANVEGLWDGPARDCPLSTRNAIGLRLKRLRDLGAIHYEPARYEGDLGRIGLPRAGELGPSRQTPGFGVTDESQTEGPREPNAKAPHAKPESLGSTEGCTPRYKPEVAGARANGTADGSSVARLAPGTTTAGDVEPFVRSIAEMCARHNGTQWTAHSPEVEYYVEWVREALPEWLHEGVDYRLRKKGCPYPYRVVEVALALAGENGITPSEPAPPKPARVPRQKLRTR